MKCGDLRKGSFVVIKGKPCKVRAAAAAQAKRQPPSTPLAPRAAPPLVHPSPPPPPLPPSRAPLQVEEITTSKTGKHGHAKANYYGYDIFTHKRYEDCEPTTHNVMVPVVTRTEYLLTDINEDDKTENGDVVTLMTEGGDQREDLRLPDTEPYTNLRTAFAKGDKEVWITVINAMDINMIDPQCVGRASFPSGGGGLAPRASGPLLTVCSPAPLSNPFAPTHSTLLRRFELRDAK